MSSATAYAPKMRVSMEEWGSLVIQRSGPWEQIRVDFKTTITGAGSADY